MTTLQAHPGLTALAASAPRIASRIALRRSVLASYLGSAVEYYDFFIYGTAAALVFPTVFFPNLSPMMATVASLGSFATAFVARPFGAAFFGHFGDRLGRKRTLMMTLLLMGVATVGVGLLPGAATIGMAAPMMLVGLRLLQGFAVGGEWAGAVLMCAENSPQHRRGRSCMFVQLGIGTAVIIANLVFLSAHALFGESSAEFLSWGWRIPFLLSAVLIGVGVYVRLHLEETVEFAAASAAPVKTALPIVELMRRQTPQLLSAAGATAGAVMLFYQVGTFMSTYAEGHLHLHKETIFGVGALGGVALMVGATISGFLSDTFGRRRLAAIGYAVAVPWSFAMLPMVQTGEVVFFAVTVLATYFFIGFIGAPLSAFLPGNFATRHRYTGAAMANNLGAILGGALPPMVSPLLVQHGNSAIGAMMAGFALLGLVSVLRLQESC
jgi:MFS family permease